MIDMHSHALFGVDDGAQTLTESIDMLKMAKAVGFDTVVLAPHYMVYKGYTSAVAENEKQIDRLKEALEKEGVFVTLIQGNELLYDYALVEQWDTGQFAPLGTSDTYLIETTREGGTALGLQNFMRKISQRGHKTILAHPERYDFVQDDPNVLKDFIEQGTLIQSNYLSLLDYYDQATTKTIQIMLENKMVHFLGSDAHQQEGYALYPKAFEVGRAIVGDEQWFALTQTNPAALLAGEKIAVSEPGHYRAPVKKAVLTHPVTGILW
ncbi:MAG: capsular biosynthesis protein [Eubacteriaceae bacterium]|jgi:protein-tyrosine phosphatase|nr:capsular biosynthesis protein [Eubacteriaceae bacterium]MDD4508108.1 capsular biosynthesis protein [Eubacteriaceae bacterium]